MKKTYLSLILTITLTAIVANTNFAVAEDADDCSWAIWRSLSDLQENFWKELSKCPAEKTLTKKWLNRALANLKAHCCAENHWEHKTCQEDKTLLPDAWEYPQSNYLFDHIVDIMIRRTLFTWYSEEFAWYYEDLDDVRDEKAKERRNGKWNWKGIIPLALAPNWHLPTEFLTKYKEYRWLQENNKYYIREYRWEALIGSSSYREGIDKLNKDKKIFDEYDQWNLLTRYRNLCQNAIYIMTYLLNNQNKASQLTTGQTKCTALTNSLIKWHARYIENLIITKSNQLIDETLENYSEKYMKETRSNEFQKKNTDSISDLRWIKRIIRTLYSKCS